MNYKELYDSENFCLKTSKLYFEELDEVGASVRQTKENAGSPVVTSKRWYRGFVDPIDPDGNPLFPNAHSIVYLTDGYTGAETRVETEMLMATGTFDVTNS